MSMKSSPSNSGETSIEFLLAPGGVGKHSDIEMSVDDPEGISRSTSRRLVVLGAILASSTVLGLFGLTIPGQMHSVPGMPLIAISSLIVALGLGILYFYAYFIYDDRFYAYIATGWIANSVYIAWEGFTRVQLHGTWRLLIVFLFAQAYQIPFFIASFCARQSSGGNRTRPLRLELISWWSAITMAIVAHSLMHPGTLATGSLGFLPLLLAVAYAIRSLTLLGNAFKRRLASDVHGRWALLIPASFFVYAALQPIYLLNVNSRVQMGTFLIALGVKVFNGIGVIAMTMLDLGTLKQRLEIAQTWQDLGILTFAVEHDIKNPLQVISDNLVMLEEKHQANADVLTRSKKIRQEMKRIFATTEIIRTLRGGKDYYERLMQKTNISSVVEKSIHTVKIEYSAGDINFVRQEGIHFVKAYPPQLQQVLVNIFRNAVEAIREEGPTSGTIRVRYEKLSDRRIAVRVSDNGCGMEPDVIPLLGKFYSTKTEVKANSGVGLYVSKRILGFHNAHLEWESERHKGTIVSIIFPLWKPNERA
jgi:signal transduction histidine kinase